MFIGSPILSTRTASSSSQRLPLSDVTNSKLLFHIIQQSNCVEYCMTDTEFGYECRKQCLEYTFCSGKK
jgi:hypothetical protein